MNNTNQELQPKSIDKLMDKDVWQISELGLSNQPARNQHTISFSRIVQPWLKQAVKKFIKLHAITRSASSCRSYISSLTRFSLFFKTLDVCSAASVNRECILDFITYLNSKKLGNTTKNITLGHLKIFHLICVQENWLPWPNKLIIYPSDIPKCDDPIPRHIPKHVMTQLNQNLHFIKNKSFQRITILLIETGRRISEICSLKYDCLQQDNDGDWFLIINEHKMKRTRLIPISPRCLKATKDQQAGLIAQGRDLRYLFPSKSSLRSKQPYYGACHVNVVLKELAKERNITDENGKVWDFQAHQFRHTIGTNMVNAGVPLVMIKKYLGHESCRMTEVYAHIHDKTLKKEYLKFQESFVNIQGDNELLEAQWLKKNIASQALPNGLCALPASQQKCPHANACLTCANFRTSKDHLPNHKDQLKQTMKLINDAKESKCNRIIEMNTSVANNLKKIINKLEGEQNEKE